MPGAAEVLPVPSCAQIRRSRAAAAGPMAWPCVRAASAAALRAPWAGGDHGGAGGVPGVRPQKGAGDPRAMGSAGVARRAEPALAHSPPCAAFVVRGAAQLGPCQRDRRAERARRRRAGRPQVRRDRPVPPWLLAGAAAGLATRQERAAAAAVTATGAELHKHCVPGAWLPHCSLAPRALLAQLPVLAAAVCDVLPLHARLDRAALINSAIGELWPLQTVP